MDQPLVRTSLIFTSALLGGVFSPLAGVSLPLDKLVEGLFAQHDANQRKKLKAFGQSMAEELAIIGPREEGTHNAVCLTIETAIQRFPISHRRLVELNLDPDKATAELAPRLAFATPSERTELKNWCERLIRTFYDKLPRHAHILAEMLPDIWAVVLQRQAEQDRKLDTIIEQNKRQLELLEQEKGIPHAALLGHLVKLGADERIEQVQVPAFLERFATEFVTLREQWTRASNADPGIAAAREEALALLNTGDLDGARQLFRTTRARIRELRQEKAREEATLLADEASVDRIDLRYRVAATLLAEAADLTAFDPATSWVYRLDQAAVMQDLGQEFGDNASLAEAIQLLEHGLTLTSRDSRPAHWAAIQNNLGNALWCLGERLSDSTTLERAVHAFREALLEITRERTPHVWAAIQNNLGNALRALGERSSDLANLNRAIECFDQALLEQTRERAPLEWAMTQDNLGGTLKTIGERSGDLSKLRRAIKAFKQTFIVYTREQVPLKWATSQSNLGNVLQSLGNLTRDAALLRSAVEAYNQALIIQTRERVPHLWAFTENNLGNALRTLGELQRDAQILRQSVQAFERALLELTPERSPSYWARTQENVAVARFQIYCITGDLGELQWALNAVDGALCEYRAGHAEFHIGTAQRLRAQITAALRTAEG
jgi:tetratricopeptide (TPR) repeat protein